MRVGILAFAAAALAVTAIALAHAQEPPAAPTNLRIEGDMLVWQDNSDDEEGFRVRKAVGGGEPEIVETLPANTASAAVPQTTTDEQCEGVALTVVAFNDYGESGPSETIGIVATDCDDLVASPAPTPTATPDGVTLPVTGAGGPGATSRSINWAMASALVAVAISLAAFGLTRARRPRN